MKLTIYQLKVLRVWLRYHHSGYSFHQWFLGYWKILLFLGVLLGISIFLIFGGLPAVGWAYLGFFLGTLLRDLTYFRLGQRNWPVMMDVVNWNRVQQLVDDHENAVK